jgi:hypothetical protein
LNALLRFCGKTPEQLTRKKIGAVKHYLKCDVTERFCELSFSLVPKLKGAVSVGVLLLTASYIINMALVDTWHSLTVNLY